MASTSLDLSQIRTDALSSGATFRTLIGLGSSDSPTYKGIVLATGTITASTPAIDISQTWNNNAATFKSMNVAVTDTNSGYFSSLISASRNGSEIFKVSKNGYVSVSGGYSFNPGGGTEGENGLFKTNYLVLKSDNSVAAVFYSSTVAMLNSTRFLSWSSGNSDDVNAIDVGLCRDAANTLAQRNQNTPASAQRFNLYGTYTNASNYRRLYLDSTTAGAFKIGAEGLGTGASENTLALQTNGTSKLTVSASGGVDINGDLTFSASPYYQSFKFGSYEMFALWDAGHKCGPKLHINDANGGTLRAKLTHNGTGIFRVEIPWTTSPGSIQAADGQFYAGSIATTKPAVDVTQTWDSNISVTGASGNGTTATLTFAAMSVAFPVGSTIIVASVNPSGYNGTFTVTASTTTSVSYANTTTGAYVSGGNIQQQFTGIKLNVTDTASASGSLLQDWQVGGSSQFQFTKNRQLYINSYQSGYSSSNYEGFLFNGGPQGGSVRHGLTARYGSASNGIMLWALGVGYAGVANWGAWFNTQIGFSSTDVSSSNPDTFLVRDAANVLAVQNSTAAQNFRLYGTYTNASNYNRLAFTSTTGGDYVLQPENAGTSANAGSLTINLSGNPTYKAQIEYNGGGMNFRLGAAPFVIQMFGDAFMPAGANTGSLGHEGYSRPWQYVYANRYSAGGQSLTGSQATSLFDATATWNTTGTPIAIKVRITDTASNANSRLLSLEQSTTNVVGDYYRFLVDKSGAFTSTGNALIGLGQGGGATVNVGNGFYIIGNGSGLSCHGSIATILASSKGIYLSADTNAWESHNGTATAATFRNYKTRSNDLANYERLALSSTTYSSAVYQTILCESGGTGAANINLVLSPKGTGAILAQVPDGTATGGNARGTNAIDLQWMRTANTQVAAGNSSIVMGTGNTASSDNSIAIGKDNSVSNPNVGGPGVGPGSIAIGSSNIVTSTFQPAIAIGGGCQATKSGAFGFGYACWANGRGSIAGGEFSRATGEWSIALGAGTYGTADYAIGAGYYSLASAVNSFATGADAKADRYGMMARSSGIFGTAGTSTGDAQFALFTLRRKTTDATATTLMLDGSTTRLTIPSGKVFAFVAKISGIKSDGSAVAFYTRKGCIKNVGGATSLIGAIETIGTDVEDNTATDVAITADDTNDALQINVTGITGETWRWVAVVEGVEIGYGT